MYSGIMDGGLLETTEIFSTIQNANFLGIDELLGKAAESFASRWKILAFSPLFRRSIVNSEFVGAILQGHPTSVFGKYLFGRRLEI